MEGAEKGEGEGAGGGYRSRWPLRAQSSSCSTSNSARSDGWAKPEVRRDRLDGSWVADHHTVTHRHTMLSGVAMGTVLHELAAASGSSGQRDT